MSPASFSDSDDDRGLPLDERESPDDWAPQPFEDSESNKSELYLEYPERSRIPVQKQEHPNYDFDIECAAQKLGTSWRYSRDEIAAMTAVWKAGQFLKLTGFDVKFPVGLTITGARAFVEASKRNQWASRTFSRRGGVDRFIEETFENVLRNNTIPVTLMRYTDNELYDRVVEAHARGLKLPSGVVYDVTGGEKRRPRIRSRVVAETCDRR